MNELTLGLNDEQRKEIKNIKLKHGSAFYKERIEDSIIYWTSLVKRCEKGYDSTIDEYRNDLDTRSFIQYVIDDLSDRKLADNIYEIVKPWDERFKAQLIETDKCIWGVTWACHLPKEKYFWVWGVTRNAKGRLLEDLSSEYAPVKYDYYNKHGGSRIDLKSSPTPGIRKISIDGIASFKPNIFHTIQLALLGEITCNVSGVTIGWSERERVIFIRWVLDKVTESEVASIDEVGKLMLTRYPDVSVHSEYVKLNENDRLQNYVLMEWVYFKKV